MGKESDLYDQYNTKTLGGDLRLDVDTYENVQDQVHVESVNRKLLELTDLIGRVTNNRSTSGPIPGTSFNTQQTIVGSGSGNGKDVFTPSSGEVWSLQGMTFEESLTSGNAVVYVGLKDSSGMITYFSIDTTGGSPWSPDNEFNKQVYVDENMTLFVYVFGTFAGSESVICTFNLIRVR